MRIFNESKTTELNENQIDLKVGFLKSEQILKEHHPKQEYQKEQFHYEVIEGDKIVKVIDIPETQAQDAYDEYEDILVYCKYDTEFLTYLNLEEKKKRLIELSKDIVQHLAGVVVENILNKKIEFCNLLNDIRVLEGKTPKQIDIQGVNNV